MTIGGEGQYHRGRAGRPGQGRHAFINDCIAAKLQYFLTGFYLVLPYLRLGLANTGYRGHLLRCRSQVMGRMFAGNRCKSMESRHGGKWSNIINFAFKVKLALVLHLLGECALSDKSL